MGQKVVHFEILGKDGKKTMEFYSKLFDWKIDANNPMNYGLVDPSQTGIGGGVSQAQDRPLLTFYVEVADPAATLKQVEALGGKTVMAPMEVPGGPTIAQFQDPDGNIVGLTRAGTMGA